MVSMWGVAVERLAGWVGDLIQLAGWVELMDWMSLIGVQGGWLRILGGGYRLRGGFRARVVEEVRRSVGVRVAVGGGC